MTQRIDPWTGFAETITVEHEVLRNNTAIMTARGVVIARDGTQVFGILTSLRRLEPNGPIIRSMSSGSTRLDYRRHDRLLTQCRDRCRRTETGVIVLSEKAFHIAARTGLPLRVQGRRDRYATIIPAALFAATLDAVQPVHRLASVSLPPDTVSKRTGAPATWRKSPIHSPAGLPPCCRNTKSDVRF